jgi:hypothetical protein
MSPIRTVTGEEVSPLQCITAHELADILRIKEQTLRVWRTRGTGPNYVRWGTDVRYQISDINAWLDRNRVIQQPGSK